MAYLEIEGSGHKIDLDDKAEHTMGRTDPATHSLPDVDLTPFGGLDMGISRRHAKVTRLGEDRYYIMDLSSTNFTHVNSERLEAFEPKVLAEGDEIFLGTMKLVFHV